MRVDDGGKIHLTGMKAVEEPPSLVDLRKRTTAMLPRVELPEVILEVMSWVPELAEAFTAVSGGRSRLEDLPISIAACLAAHSACRERCGIPCTLVDVIFGLDGGELPEIVVSDTGSYVVTWTLPLGLGWPPEA